MGLALVVISLAIGMAGAYFEDLGFIEAFINASMILSGMGPILNPKSAVFAGF